jgi:hypothetical protein
METIEKYNQSKNILDTINNSRTETIKKFKDEENKAYNIKSEDERKLMKVYYDKIKVLNNKLDIDLDKYSSKSESHNNNLKEFKRILRLMEVDTKINVLDYEVYYMDYLKRENGYSDIEQGKQKLMYKKIDVLENTKALNLKIYVVKNNKPKNKYSLMGIGKSIYDYPILLMPNKYVSDVHTDNANIVAGIKDFPSKIEAEKYYFKSKNKILESFRAEHKRIEQEHFEVLELKKNPSENKKWRIALIKNKLEYFEKHYSNGTEEIEYIALKKELEGI